MNENEFNKINVFGKGNPNDGFAMYFTGNSYLNPLTKPGESAVFLANVKHWHGAANCWFSHIAVEVPGENTKTEWCESVSDEEHDRLGD